MLFKRAKATSPGSPVITAHEHKLSYTYEDSQIPYSLWRNSAHAVRTVKIIAESQAAPSALHTLATEPAFAARVNQLVLLQPLGLNAAAFGDTATERMRIFKQRVAKNTRYQISSALDLRLLRNHQQIIRIARQQGPKSNAQYASGLAYNAVPGLQHIVSSGIPVSIICGANDQIFPTHEIRAALAGAKITVPIIRVPGVPHSPLATKAGLKLLTASWALQG